MVSSSNEGMIMQISNCSIYANKKDKATSATDLTNCSIKLNKSLWILKKIKVIKMYVPMQCANTSG